MVCTRKIVLKIAIPGGTPLRISKRGDASRPVPPTVAPMPTAMKCKRNTIFIPNHRNEF